MKKILSTLIAIVAIAILAASCNSRQSFTIYGEVSNINLDGCMIKLYTLDNDTIIDSTTITNGKFQFTGELEKPMMGDLRATNYETGISVQSVLVLEDGKIHINIYNDSLYGTPLNDLLYKTYTADSVIKDYNKQMEALVNKYTDAPSKQAQLAILDRFENIQAQAAQHKIGISRQMFRNNMDNVLGAYALSQIVEVDGISYDSLDYYMNNSGPIFADYEPLRKQRTHLFHVENTAVGKKFVDIEGIDMASGSASRLSCMIKEGDITIIDFWASWCSPCRQEISENLIRLYKKYSAKGVNIIGIDVWEKDRNDHAAAVEKLGIKYPQLIDTTGSTATELYGVEGVPTILLIGPDGTILYRDLRGEDIEAAIIKELEAKKN